MEIFWELLTPGGLWVNAGPLQYISNVEAYNNFQPQGFPIELTWEEVEFAIKRFGFELKVRIFGLDKKGDL